MSRLFPLLLTACSSGGSWYPDASPDASLPTKRGALDVQMLVPAFSSVSPETLIEGAFVSASGVCEHTTIDTCEITRCPTGASETLAAPGKLHVGFPGGSEFAWDPGAFPVQFSADSIPWAAGEVIRVRSDGKDVPTFDLSTASPNTLDAGFDGPLLNQTLSRTSPLYVSWTAVTGDVVVTIRQDARSDRPRTSIACTASGTTGSISIPATVLGKLELSPTTSGDTTVRAWLATTATVRAGDYAIRLRALRNWSDQYRVYRVQ